MNNRVLKNSAAAIALLLCIGIGSCNDRPEEGKGVIQHPQSHDHVMGEGLDEGELEAAEDTLERADTVQQQRRKNEEEPEGENR